jgi:cysteine desulfurase
MKKQNKERVFLDYASITPLGDEVAREIGKIQKEFWANPSSLHTEGEMAKNLLEESKIKIAEFLHCRAGEIFLTSGGTESLNIAILGVIRGSSLKTLAPKDDPQEKLPHIIVSTIEHPAVLEPIKFLLKEKKVEVSFVTPNEKGIINPESIKKEIKENTVLVVIQHANNEIGTIQPIREISKALKESKITLPLTCPHFVADVRSSVIFDSYPLLLVDACQSVLYEDVSLERLGADMLVLDGVKMYGPRGAGILAIKHNVQISPIIFGGGQQNGLRPGTENVFGAVGLAKALEVATKLRKKESERLTKLRDYAIKKIISEIPNSSLNGGQENRLPNNINICFPKTDSEFLVIKLDTLGFAVSAASACHVLSLENGSYVIEALGNARSTSSGSSKCSGSSLRITLGRDTKKNQLDTFVVALKKILC